MRIHPTSTTYLGDEQSVTESVNIDLESLKNKYGSKPEFSLLYHFGIVKYSYNWNNEKLDIGAVFGGDYKFNLVPNSLEMSDRIASNNNKIYIDNPSLVSEPRMILPFNIDEIIFGAEYLKYIYYYNNDTAIFLKKREAQYIKNTEEMLQNAKKKSIQENSENL